MFESKTFPSHDPALIETLCSLIHKMTFVRVRPPSVFSKVSHSPDPRNYILLNSHTFYWCRLPKDFTPSLIFRQFSRCKNYFLLQDYHGGRDGCVWLAADRTGGVCVSYLFDNVSRVPLSTKSSSNDSPIFHLRRERNEISPLSF